jgi:hypothetical protein
LLLFSQSVAKVRVSIQKSRNEACALLIDPTQSVEHCLQQIIDKAKSKFRIKAKHLYIVNTAAQGGGTELTTDNLRQHLKDGLVVLASPITRLGSQMIVAQQLDHAHASPTIGPEDDGGAAAAAAAAAAGEGGMAQLYLADGAATASNGAGGSGSSAAGAAHRATTSASVSHGEQKDLTDSGSCSSELEELDGAEQRSVVSFDSESLYSFTTAAEHPSASAPAAQHLHHPHQHHHPQHHQSHHHPRHPGGRGGTTAASVSPRAAAMQAMTTCAARMDRWHRRRQRRPLQLLCLVSATHTPAIHVFSSSSNSIQSRRKDAVGNGCFRARATSSSSNSSKLVHKRRDRVPLGVHRPIRPRRRSRHRTRMRTVTIDASSCRLPLLPLPLLLLLLLLPLPPRRLLHPVIRLCFRASCKSCMPTIRLLLLLRLNRLRNE